MIWVLDASVALRWYLQEESDDYADEVLKKIVDEQDYGLLAEELKNIKRLIDNLRAEKYPGIDFATASIEQISKTTSRNFNTN